MPRLPRLACFALALALALFAPAPHADACTSIRLKNADGSVVYARTMEYGQPLASKVAIFPKGTAFIGLLPDGSAKGLAFTGKYGFVGMNAFGSDITCDGLNEKGLMVGALLFPGYAAYQPSSPTTADSTITQFQVVNWLLSQCATVADVKREIAKIRVCQGPQVFNGVPIGTLPLHFTVHDATGASIVLEHLAGELRIHDNPLGVLTNSPDFDWMLTYLSNTVNLSATNVPALDLKGYVVRQIGQGSGMLGLPGDFTPPSRFVRMVALSQSALPAANAEAGTSQAMTIIGNVDIPKGAVRGTEDGKPVYDVTEWAVVADAARGRYYWRSATDKNWRYVDLAQALAGTTSPASIAIDTPPAYPNATNTAKPGL
jgi:choloylglycine hydrolase